MTLTTTDSPSRRVAAELRAEAARQGISIREIARRMEVTQMWLSRRVKVDAPVHITFEDLERITAALDTTPERILGAAGWPVTYGYTSLAAAA